MGTEVSLGGREGPQYASERPLCPRGTKYNGAAGQASKCRDPAEAGPPAWDSTFLISLKMFSFVHFLKK